MKDKLQKLETEAAGLRLEVKKVPGIEAHLSLAKDKLEEIERELARSADWVHLSGVGVL